MQKGGCQCGAIRYESEGQPIALYICHCRECQKQSASAFGISLDVNRSLSYYSRKTEILVSHY